MIKEMTDAQIVRLLKKEVKEIVRRHEECMLQRDNLVIALQNMITAFCSGADWAAVPVRWEADLAIAAAHNKGTYGRME